MGAPTHSLSPSPPCSRDHVRVAGKAYLKVAERVVAVEVLVPSVHLQGIFLRLLHQRLPEHCGLFSEGTGHQRQGHVLGGHLEGEALL